MQQQRPRDRRFLLPVALLLVTSLSDRISAISLTVKGSDRRLWPVNDDQDGPSIPNVKELENGWRQLSDLSTGNIAHVYERQKKKHGTFTLTLYGLIKAAQQRAILYSNTVIGTLAVNGWAVTFGTARRGLGVLRLHPVPYSLYQM